MATGDPEECPGTVDEATLGPISVEQAMLSGSQDVHGSKGDANVENQDRVVQFVDEIDFPKSLLKRIVKEQIQKVGGNVDSGQGDVQVNKEATLAFNEASKMFIHYLTCAANDICMEAKRQTIGVEDVFKALSDIDFETFVEPLRASLANFKSSKQNSAVKRKAIDGDVVQQDPLDEDEEAPNTEKEMPTIVE